jgi:hypothetical protein
MSVRKELLERELSKLGFRKADRASSTNASPNSQQQGQSGRPQAEDGGQHGD